MFRVLVLLVLVGLGCAAVCGCVGGGAKPPSLQASNLPAGGEAARAVFAARPRHPGAGPGNPAGDGFEKGRLR